MERVQLESPKSGLNFKESRSVPSVPRVASVFPLSPFLGFALLCMVLLSVSPHLKASQPPSI